MARPRQMTDEAILEIARECFLEHGASVSTRTIADRVGLSQPALFKRFGTKLALMLKAIGLAPAPPWAAQCALGPDDRPVPDQLYDLASHMLGFFTRMVPRMMVLRSHGITPADLFDDLESSPPVRGLQIFRQWLDVLVEQGRMRPVDTTMMAATFLGQIQSRAFIQHTFGHHLAREDDASFLRHVVDIAWHGIQPTECAP
ncbi:MAG: TetR/AcrR family transcriptional regulator [Myxococcota bacterium]